MDFSGDIAESLGGSRKVDTYLVGVLMLLLGLRQPSEEGLLGTELPHSGIVTIQTHGI